MCRVHVDWSCAGRVRALFSCWLVSRAGVQWWHVTGLGTGAVLVSRRPLWIVWCVHCGVYFDVGRNVSECIDWIQCVYACAYVCVLVLLNFQSMHRVATLFAFWISNETQSPLALSWLPHQNLPSTAIHHESRDSGNTDISSDSSLKVDRCACMCV